MVRHSGHLSERKPWFEARQVKTPADLAPIPPVPKLSTVSSQRSLTMESLRCTRNIGLEQEFNQLKEHQAKLMERTCDKPGR